MPIANTLIFQRLAALFVIVTLLAPSLPARNRKGDKFTQEGLAHVGKIEWDKALEKFEQALATDPLDTYYQLNVRRARFEAGALFIDRGQKLRNEGKFAEALREFQRAYVTDPSSSAAEAEMRRTYQMIQRDEERKKRGEPELTGEEKGRTPYQQSRLDSEERIKRMQEVPELEPSNPRPVDLKMNQQPPKILFETLGKLAGVNVLFDNEFVEQTQSRRYSVDLNATTLEESLDYLALVTKAFWKPLSRNAIFVTADNITKRRDYEEHVTRVFYIQNVTSPQDLTEIMTAMRAVVEARKVMPYNGQNAIVVRGTADQIALCEKVLNDLDKPRPEVMIDVYILETVKGRVRDLASTFLSGGAPGINQPVTYLGAGTPGTGGAPPLRLNALDQLRLSDFATSVPNFIFQAVLTDNQSRVVNQPQLRVMDGQKAQINLGQRYPIATGSFQPGVGGVGLNPLVSTQFQFQDIGVNVGVTPRIHLNDEVSMEIEAEVSGLQGNVNVGGLVQPIIGSRKVKHIIRVKEGEITLVGGLMSVNESRTRAGVPFLMDVPGLGRLFSTEKIDRSQQDVLIALIPHVVRAPEITPENLKSVASGVDQIWKISFAPKRGRATGAATGGGTQTAPPAGAPLNPMEPRATPPPPPVEMPKPAPAPKPAAPAAGPRVLFRTPSAEAAVGGGFTVDVQVENVNELFTSPMRLKFDASVVRLVDIQRGGFLGGDGQNVTFSETRIDNPGGAVITMNRVPGAGGISGSGTLVTLKFQALKPGETTVSFEELALRDARLQAIEVTPPTAVLKVK